MCENPPLFKDYHISFRNPKSFHKFHESEGITEELIEEVLKKATEYKEDPRKLRKKIRLYYVTQSVTPMIRITIIFQIFPNEKRVHVLNAFLGSFHFKTLQEKLGLKEKIPKEVKKVG